MSSLQKFHRRTQPFVVNTLHTGTVTITGTAAVGSVLSVNSTISDANGLGTFAYQWKRAGSAISGATGTTYTLVSADANNTITVTITYTDGNGFIETETSAATASVIGTWPATAIGGGDATNGFWLGDISSNKLVVAPKSSEANLAWGSYGTTRGTVNTTNGLANTNTLYALGSAAHPAAYYCKTLTLGGYTTWYLPAKNELSTLSANQSATPFATANSFVGGGNNYGSSTEFNNNYCQAVAMSTGVVTTNFSKNWGSYCRPVRRTAV